MKVGSYFFEELQQGGRAAYGKIRTLDKKLEAIGVMMFSKDVEFFFSPICTLRL